MNARNLFGINCISHLLNFMSWYAISLYVLLTINLLILHTVLPKVFFMFPSDPFFLSVIPRLLNTFMLRSANWGRMIPLIWVKSNYADVSCFTCMTISALQISGSFPILEGNGFLKKFRKSYLFTTLFVNITFMVAYK